MTTTAITSKGRLLLALAATLFLSACATTASKEQIVVERAEERWAYQLAGDYAAAYEYLAPSFRSSVSLNQYMRTLLLRKVNIQGASYVDSDCLEEACKLRFSLNYFVIAAVPGINRVEGEKVSEENWVSDQGNWWLVPE